MVLSEFTETKVTLKTNCELTILALIRALGLLSKGVGILSLMKSWSAPAYVKHGKYRRKDSYTRRPNLARADRPRGKQQNILNLVSGHIYQILNVVHE